MKRNDRTAHYFVWISVLLLIEGCARDSQMPESMLGPKSIESAAILGRGLSLESWDEARSVRVGAAIVPLEYHLATASGKTLIHAIFQIEDRVFRELVAEHRRHTPTFVIETENTYAFGPDSHWSFENDGSARPRPLDWWKPEGQESRNHYFWSIQPGGNITRRVWLQVADRENGMRLVYMRIENE
jgi:hypothetical protein